MKSNKFSDTVKEYVRKLSDDDVRFLHLKMSQRIGPDLAEAIEVIQKNSDVDYWLNLSKSANEFYDMIDLIDVAIQSEAKRRISFQEVKSK